MVGNISLKWDHHSDTLLKGFTSLRQTEAYCDATLTCAGRFYRVHRFVLSACSEYLALMFKEANICSSVTHPVIVLQDIKPEYLEALLNYMYVGEVSIPQGDIPELLKAAEYLNIKGLNAQGDALSIHREEGTQAKKRLCSAPTRQDKFRKRDSSSSPVNTNVDPLNEGESNTVSKQASYVSISSNQEMTSSVLEFEGIDNSIGSEEIAIQDENSYLEMTPGNCIDTVPELPIQKILHSQAKQLGRIKLLEEHSYHKQGLSSIECLSDNTLFRTVVINGNNNWVQSIHIPETQQQDSSEANVYHVESENKYASIQSIKPLTKTKASYPDAANNNSTGERPFVCPICNQCFGHNIVKTLHMFRYHNETPPILEGTANGEVLLSDL